MGSTKRVLQRQRKRQQVRHLKQLFSDSKVLVRATEVIARREAEAYAKGIEDGYQRAITQGNVQRASIMPPSVADVAIVDALQEKTG